MWLHHAPARPPLSLPPCRQPAQDVAEQPTGTIDSITTASWRLPPFPPLGLGGLTRAEPMSRLTPLRAAPTRTRSSYTTSLGIRGTDAGLIKFGRQPSSQPHQPSLPTFALANLACDHRCASIHLSTTRSCDTALAAPWQSPTLTCLETGYARGVGGDGLPGASPLRASVLYACQRSRLRSMRRFTPRGPRPPRD